VSWLIRGSDSERRRAYKTHDFDADCREQSLGALSRQHDAVGAVEDGVGDVACFSTRRTRLLGHAVQHLSEWHTTTAAEFFNPLECRRNYSATSNNMKLVHWPLMGGLYSEEERKAGPQPAQAPPRCTKRNSLLINGQCTHQRPPYCCITVRCSATLMCPLNTTLLNGIYFKPETSAPPPSIYKHTNTNIREARMLHVMQTIFAVSLAVQTTLQ